MVTLRGVVLADGNIQVLDQHTLAVGLEVEIVVKSASHTAAQQWSDQQTSRELSEQDRVRLQDIYAGMDQTLIDDSGLPADYMDQLDHYMRGTPKRRTPPEA